MPNVLLSLMSAILNSVSILNFPKIHRSQNYSIKWAPEIKVGEVEAGWIMGLELWIKCNILNHKILLELDHK